MEEKKSITEVMKELEKKYGKGAIIHGNETPEVINVIDSGSIGLNDALGVGGIPEGKIISISGWQSTGKSTLSQTIVGNAQKKGHKCIYVDSENSIDLEYAKSLGVNMEELYIIQMDEFAGEGAIDKVHKLVETGEIGLVIYDSYNAIQPRSVIQGDATDANMGRHAKMMGNLVMKDNYLATKYGTTFIYCGQFREKIGVMYGPTEIEQGGNALKFYAHVRLVVSRSITKDNTVMNGVDKIGNKTTIKVEKNKLAPPFKSCSFNIIYGKGIDKFQEIIDLGKSRDVLKLRAGIITYDNNKYNEEEFKLLLIDNPEFLKEISDKILNKEIIEVYEDKKL